MKKFMILLAVMTTFSATAGILDEYSGNDRIRTKIESLDNSKEVHNFINENVSNCSQVNSALIGLDSLSEKFRLDRQAGEKDPYGKMIDSLTTAFIEKNCYQVLNK